MDNENNQWEDELEYTEDMDSNEEAEFLDDQDSLPEEQMPENDSEEYTDDVEEDVEEYEEEGEDEPAKKKSALPLVALFLILLLAGAFIAVPKLMNKDGNTTENYNVQQNQTEQSTEDLAGSFFDAASNDDSNMMSINFNENGEGFTVDNTENTDNNAENNNNEKAQENIEVATVTEAKPGEGITESDLFEDQSSQENDSIMVVYNKAVRQNPFKPPVVSDSSNTPYETINNTQFEIVEPPTASIPDENLAKLLQTQISGIMYDPVSPAAIVNLSGIDHFVKVGDVIAGYKIEKITKDKVQISYKSNNYVASVGELFTKGKLEQLQAVADLEHKFGGRSKNNN